MERGGKREGDRKERDVDRKGRKGERKRGRRGEI